MSDRLFLPVNTRPYQNYKIKLKDIEARGINNQYNTQTVTQNKRVEIRKGYNGPSLWGTIQDTWRTNSIHAIPDTVTHHRILPGVSRLRFIKELQDLLGDYDDYILFEIDLD